MMTIFLELFETWSRQIAIAVSVYLVSHGILRPDQSDRFVVAFVKDAITYGPGILAAVWGTVKTVQKRSKFLRALAANIGATEADLAADKKAGVKAPSVFTQKDEVPVTPVALEVGS